MWHGDLQNGTPCSRLLCDLRKPPRSGRQHRSIKRRNWGTKPLTGAPMHRLFVAVRLPGPVRDLLIDAMDEGTDFRWQGDDQLHLTLRFVGEVDRPLAEDLAVALGRIRASCFSIRIKGVGHFEQRNSGALWAGVEPKDALAALAAKIERICQEVGLEPERRVFHPHITMARWKGRRTREVREFLERRQGLVSQPFAIDAFVLFESRLSRHGAHYEEAARYPLE